MDSTSSDFVQLPFVVDANQLADDAIDTLRASWDGWEPNDGDPLVIGIEAVAPIASALAFVASNMPAAALRALGTKLLGIPYNPGVAAQTTVTLTMTDQAGYTVEQGLQLEIDGFAFELVGNAVVPSGQSSLSAVAVQAIDVGAEANNLTGSTAASLTLPPFVVAISVDAPTRGGEDAQTDDDYTSMVSRKQQLRAETLVTNLNFELRALDQAGIGRAHSETTAAREVTVTVADSQGEPVSAAVKAALLADYADARSINYTPSVVDPTYCDVSVAWSGVAEPGVDKSDLTTRVNAMLSSALSPAAYGVPRAGNPNTTWISDAVIRKNVIITKIGEVQGMQYVENVTLSSDTAGSSVGANGDLTMPGTVPLPRVGNLNGAVT